MLVISSFVKWLKFSFLLIKILARKNTLECIYHKVELDFKSDLARTSDSCELSGKFYDLEGLDEKLALNSGLSRLSLSNAEITGAKIFTNSIYEVHREPIKSNEIRIKSSVEGDKSIIAIRVISADQQTSASLTDLSRNIFGIGETNGFNMVSQFDACSYGKLNFIPFQGETMTGRTILNGIGEVAIQLATSDIDSTIVEEKVLEIAEEKFGDLSSQFDYIMLCLPPGVLLSKSSEWIGYAYVNSWLSVFNDNWCNSPSAQMHELGHNLGLQHSDPDYGDESCLMGYSYLKLDGPKMCFNGQKSFQLGWYSESNIEIDISSLKLDEKVHVQLVGVADYARRGSMGTIVHLTGTFNENEYFVAFNRKTGINSGTGEGGDEVLVTKRIKGDSESDSHLIANITSDGSFHIFNTRDKTNTVIYIEQINLFADPAYATIYFSRYKEICYSDDYCDDFDECTTSYCDFTQTNNDLPGAGTCVKTYLPCEKCGSTFTLEIETNAYPELASWSVLNTDKNVEVAHGSGYQKAHTTYSEYFCLEYANYDFEFGYNESLKEGPDYEARLQGKVFRNTKEDMQTSSASTEGGQLFRISCNEESCIDFDGCTEDRFDPDTRLCTFEQINCIDCHDFELDLFLDDYPDQTTWFINEIENSKFASVVSGGPYPKQGRRKAPTKSSRKLSTYAVQESTSGNNQNPHIKHEMCLESGSYAFTIYDSFGDGICCNDGLGNYTIYVDGQLKAEGGEFGLMERIGFGAYSCVSNSKIEVNLFIQLDSKPESVSWTINLAPSSTSIRAKGPYPGRENSFIGFTTCLEKDNYKVYINDADGDGLCCSDGNGYWLLYVNHVQEKEGSVFESVDVRWFTTNVRRRELGSSSLEEYSNNASEKRQLSLLDEREDKPQSHLVTSQDTHQCSTLQTMPSTQPSQSSLPLLFLSALPSRFLSSTPSSIHSSIPSAFSINPSSFPSISDSLIPTHIQSASSSPSYSPSFLAFSDISTSKLPSSFPFHFFLPSAVPIELDDDWSIVQNENFDTFENHQILNLLGISYLVSKNKTKDQIYASIYDESCLVKRNNGEIEANATIIGRYDKYDEVYVAIKLNFSSIKESYFWSNTSGTSGIIRFCVRAELLLGNGSNISVSFADTKVNISTEFVVGLPSLEISNIELVKNNAVNIKHESKLEIDACICNQDNLCEPNPTFHQNSEAYICLSTKREDVSIAEVKNMIFYQDGIEKAAPILNGQYDQLTNTLIYDDYIRIETRLASNLFEFSEKITSSLLFINGDVIVELNRKRFLQDEHLSVEFENQGIFQLIVSLEEKRKQFSGRIFLSLTLLTFASFFVIINVSRNSEFKPVPINEL